MKSFKRHFERVVRDAKLTYEEFSTIACQIEVYMNFRPLCPMNVNEADIDVLSPGHFLIRALLNSLPEPFLEENQPLTVRSR